MPLFKGDGGHLLHYEQYGRGRSMIFIHGDMDSAVSWKGFIPYIAKTNHVVTIDTRVSSRYNPQPRYYTSGEEQYSFRMAARDVQQLLLFLNLRDVVLVGHKKGWAVIAAFVAMFPTDGRVKACGALDELLWTVEGDMVAADMKYIQEIETKYADAVVNRKLQYLCCACTNHEVVPEYVRQLIKKKIHKRLPMAKLVFIENTASPHIDRPALLLQELASFANVGDTADKLRKLKTERPEEYIERDGVEHIVNNLVQLVLTERPEKPVHYMIDQLKAIVYQRKLASMEQGSAKSPTGGMRPSSPALSTPKKSPMKQGGLASMQYSVMSGPSMRNVNGPEANNPAHLQRQSTNLSFASSSGP